MVDNDKKRTFGFEGAFHFEAIERGDLKIAGQLIGEFDVDKQTRRVTHFRGYFEGKEVGTVVTGGDVWDLTCDRRPPCPLYFVMEETAGDDLVARTVAPVLRNSLGEYRSPKMGAAWERRYGKVAGPEQQAGEVGAPSPPTGRMAQ